jgi:hypothetical protein
MKTLWAEMARRKVQFHHNEEWDSINCWLPAYKSEPEVKQALNKGLLFPFSDYAPRCIGWYKPTLEAWEQLIKPLVEAYTLDELTRLAGWR